MIARGRQNKGEARIQAKLSDADVMAIRAAYAEPGRTVSQREMARRYGVSQTLVSHVVNRRGWFHI
jgi:DNA-binding GntR family transcriptional regulator